MKRPPQRIQPSRNRRQAPTAHPRTADGAIQQHQQHAGATAHQKRLLEGVMPERLAHCEDEHQPDQAQHDAVSFAVVVEETRGEGHSRLLHVVE